MESYKLKPTLRELATILAALRYWQENQADSRLLGVYAEHFADTTALTAEEINCLCEKLNFSS